MKGLDRGVIKGVTWSGWVLQTLALFLSMKAPRLTSFLEEEGKAPKCLGV